MTEQRLTRTELIEMRQNFRDLRDNIFNTRETLLDDRKLQLQDYDQMIKAERSVSQCIEKIDNTIFTEILTDIQEPKKALEFSIEKAKQGIADLERINLVLQFTSSLITLVGNIVMTIGTGNVANIANVINEIQQLPNI